MPDPDLPHLTFALALHGALDATSDAPGDLVWSPYSVASALGLAAAGAGGRTREELESSLAPGGDLADLGRLLAGAADAGEEADLAVANTLWARDDLAVEDSYARVAGGWPGGGVRRIAFRADPEAARREINADVARTTRDLITDLLAAGTVGVDTAAIIVNALYLKVAWRLPFPERDTREAPFHGPDGVREVPTMTCRERMPYAQASGWRMATLATAGDVAVDVLLADDPADRLPRPAAVVALRAAAVPATVRLSMPRLRARAGADLVEPLGRLGVREAFGRVADLHGITREPLHLDRVVHEAVLRVDEQGFEGAAATAVVMRTVGFDTSEPVEFRVDRPYLLLIRHLPSGAIYFLARVERP